MGADVSGKVCVNHPEVDATTRCVACFKPICGPCTISAGGEDFCCESCKTNHQQTNANVGAMLAGDARRARAALIKKLIILVILIAACAFGYKYLTDNPDKMDQLKGAAGEAAEKAKEAKEKAADKANELKEDADNAEKPK
jgi:hypothetical protein